MVRFGVLILSLSIFAGFMAFASAQELSQDRIRQEIMDQCVYSRFAKPDQRETAVDVCKCAAKRTVAGMDEAQERAFQRGRKLTRDHNELWKASLKACT